MSALTHVAVKPTNAESFKFLRLWVSHEMIEVWDYISQFKNFKYFGIFLIRPIRVNLLSKNKNLIICHIHLLKSINFRHFSSL